jgi:hypothetical protein
MTEFTTVANRIQDYSSHHLSHLLLAQSYRTWQPYIRHVGTSCDCTDYAMHEHCGNMRSLPQAAHG